MIHGEIRYPGPIEAIEPNLLRALFSRFGSVGLGDRLDGIAGADHMNPRLPAQDLAIFCGDSVNDLIHARRLDQDDRAAAEARAHHSRAVDPGASGCDLHQRIQLAAAHREV